MKEQDCFIKYKTRGAEFINNEYNFKDVSIKDLNSFENSTTHKWHYYSFKNISSFFIRCYLEDVGNALYRVVIVLISNRSLVSMQ